MKVCLYLADGFEEIEAISVVDILRRAALDVQVVSVMEGLEVTGAHQVVVKADVLFGEVDSAQVDMMILPGGGQGTDNMAAHSGLTAQLTAQAQAGKWVAAICAAPSILGNLGLVNGKKAICYPGFEGKLTGAVISTDDTTVVDGKIITSKGPGTAAEFALKIVAVLKGGEVADTLRGQMFIK